ncbi:MAG: hypothetical protein KDA89_02890 [Planctomycetaceae bacterium]|nr:hypothetical protein [Planctomycetaceae bacterium]
MNQQITVVGSLVVGDRIWILPAALIAAVGVLLVLWLNRRQPDLAVAVICRVFGWLLVCACLVNPLWSSARPRRGANVLAVVADVSRSHLVNINGERTRADVFRELLASGEQTEPAGWLQRLDQDFELQRYTVGDQLLRVDSFEKTTFDRSASNLCSALEQLKERFSGQPLAGIILLTDGNATDDAGHIENLKGSAPVYPVVPPDGNSVRDLALGTVSVSQTAFDDAPVTLQVQTQHPGVTAGKIQLTLSDSQGTPLESKTQDLSEESAVRFEARPETAGSVFYTVTAQLLNDDDQPVTDEATDVNNRRLVAVNRGSRKRRVLYVSGRPNWEFKFLRRAVETDPQTELVGLIRIAKKEAKFDFRGRDGERSNSLFRGFDQKEQEVSEEYDEPVLVRLGTKDETELQSGFPEDADELFSYDAIVLDDIEADFFLADQLQLIYEFVSKRGGGLLMLGGQEAFRQGEYDRTPVGEMLPVDLHREVPGPQGPVRMKLSREGLLQPWVRLRSDEAAEQLRLEQMPEFTVLNTAEFIRPGAVVMATVTDSSNNKWPAIVTQRFGRGRTAAVCVGDLWRWRMNEGRRRLQEFSLDNRNPLDAPVAPGAQPEEDLNDHARGCRQLIRWLVSDVPERLAAAAVPETAAGSGMLKLIADVRTRDFEVCDDAEVRFSVRKPNGETAEVIGEPSDVTIGRFEAVIAAVEAGAYIASVSATIPSAEGEPEELSAETGWAGQPDQEEMKSVTVSHRRLNEIAAATGGSVVSAEKLDAFVSSLAHADVPLIEIRSWPVWHQWWVFLTAIACFTTDWTIRRRRGMP